MNLTMVIICGYDRRVLDCIASVDVDVPIVVSLVPGSGLEECLRATGVEVVISGTIGNYSVSCNHGLAAVKTSRAMIVDSDCVLEKGCIERIVTLLDDHPLARAAISFRSSPDVLASEWTARLRDGVNNRQPAPAYTPGLGMRLSIVNQIGGYFLDERIFWGGDSEFSHRVERAGLSVGYDPQAIVHHAPISLWHELHSGYKLGQGSRIQSNLGLRPAYESPLWLMRRFLARVRRKTRGISHRRPWQLRLLHAGWWFAYYAGYYAAVISQPPMPKVLLLGPRDKNMCSLQHDLDQHEKIS